MKKITSKCGVIITVDGIDHKALSQKVWRLDKDGYAISGIQRMHRIVNKTPLGLLTDHINGNKLDNRKSNLRTATVSHNKMNTPKCTKNSSSRFKGVSWKKSKKRWVAYVKSNQKLRHIGYFKCEIMAAVAYDHAAKKYHGKFVSPNF